MATRDSEEHELSPGERLLWRNQQRPSPGPKPALGVETIVSEAIALADAEGLTGMSMKKLAQRLGSGTMSLYRHVPGRDELVHLMFDTALGAPAFAGSDTIGWRDAVTEWARATHRFYRSHPWALSVATAPRTMGPNETAWAEAAMRAFSHAGVPATRMGEVLLVVNGYVRGAVQPVTDDTPDGQLRVPSGLMEHPPSAAMRADFPTLTAAIEKGAFSGPEHGSKTTYEGFELGLRWLLDGIETMVTSPH